MFKKSRSKQLSLLQFTWYGFFIIGGSLGFSGNFYSTAMPSYADKSGHITSATNNPHAIGLHCIWVMMLTGLVALVAAHAYTKLARICRLRRNGFTYACTRTGFGRFAGFAVGLFTYVGLPFLITGQILYFIRGLFGGGFIGHADPRLVAQWGPFTNLWLDLISVVIYLGVAFTVFLGIRIFKRISTFTSVSAMVVQLIAIVIYFVFFTKFARPSFEWWNATPHKNAQGGLVGGGNTLHLSGMLYAFNAFFFSFTGFETFASAGRNVVNPERNLSRGVNLAMALAFLWYAFFTVIFFGTYYGEVNTKYALQQHNLVNFWGRHMLGGKHSFIYYFGIGQSIVLEGFFVVRMSSENALYGGTLLQPLAEEGYIPDKLADLTSDNIPRRASLLNLGFTVGTIFLWLIIPDFFSALFRKQIGGVIENVFSVGLFLSTSSFYTIIVYMIGVMALLKFTYEKRINLRWWQVIIFVLCVICLIVPASYYFYDIFVLLREGFEPNNLMNKYDVNKIMAGGIQLFFLLLVAGTACIVYRFYYIPKYLARLKTNPSLQKQLNSNFTIVDDWRSTGWVVTKELTNYLQRNYKVYGNRTNANHQLAVELRNKIKTSLTNQGNNSANNSVDVKADNLRTMRDELNV